MSSLHQNHSKSLRRVKKLYKQSKPLTCSLLKDFLRFSQALNFKKSKNKMEKMMVKVEFLFNSLVKLPNHHSMERNWKKEEEEKEREEESCAGIENELKGVHLNLISQILHLSPSPFHYLHIKSNEGSFEPIHVKWNHCCYGT